MTIAEKKNELIARQSEIGALNNELSALIADSNELEALKTTLPNVQVKQINIVVNPPNASKLEATIVDDQGRSMKYATETETTMHISAINAAIAHAEADIEQRIEDAYAKLNA